MINAGEVGAVFTIVDEASPVLKRVLEQMDALTAAIDRTQESLRALTIPPGLNRSLLTMERRFRAVADASKFTADATVGSFSRIDGSIATTAASLGGLSREMRTFAAEARAINGPAILRTGALPDVRPKGTHEAPPAEGGAHIGAPSVPLGGGYHVRGASMPAMAAAGTLAYGVYEASQLEDAVFKLEYHAGLAATAANNKLFKDIIQGGVSGTGFAPKDIEEAATTAVRMFKGTPGGGLDVLPELLRLASVEARLKETSLAESMKAFIGLSHMTKEYGPEAIAKLAPSFAFLSVANPSSLTRMESAASYAVPILQSGMDIDPLQTLLMGTVLTRAGITNTKSGTWLRNLFQNALPGTSLMSKTAFRHHEEALRALGLVDAKDQPTWFTDGKPDPFKLLDIGSHNAARIPLTKRAAYEKQIFGTQGEGAFAILSDPIIKQQVDALKTEMGSDGFKNRYATFLDQYKANSPAQQARLAWGDTENVMMDIGQSVLPAVTAGLSRFDAALKRLKDTTGETAGNSIIGGGLAAGALAWLFPGKTKAVLSDLVSNPLAVLGGIAAASLDWADGSANKILQDRLKDVDARHGLSDKPADVIRDLKALYGVQDAQNTKAVSAATAKAVASFDAWFQIGRQASVTDSLMKAGYTGKSLGAELEREHSRAVVFSKPPTPPTPVVDTKVDVKVLLDGRAIAAVIEKNIVI